MIAAVLTAAGYRTGLYTSPHLINFEERIRIDGKPIPKKAVAELTSRLRRSIEKHPTTFFEATTAIAFAYFAEEKTDIAIIETGLGGRLDSTNVLRPVVSVITNITLEHTEILGDSLEKIAFEKAGIIKEKTPCITGIRNNRALSVVKKVCSERHSPLVIGSNYKSIIRKASLEGTLLDLKIAGTEYKRLWLSLPGFHQIDNLGLALSTIKELRGRAGIDIPEEAIRGGLGQVRELTGLAGRLSIVQDKPTVLADVAHNADATRNLLGSLKRLKLKKPIIVFGVVKDKDYVRMIHDLAQVAGEAIAVSARSSRSRSASDVAAAFEREGCRTRAALSVEEGVKVALHLAGKGGIILVTGSHYVVGEAMQALGRKRA